MRLAVLELELEADSADAVINRLAEGMAERGFVRPGYGAAVRERERVSPTGLPARGAGVAIPHADPEFVLVPAIGFAKLTRPVFFGEMGNPEAAVPVQLVFMLAIRDSEGQLDALRRLIQFIQDDERLNMLKRARDKDAALAVLRNVFGKFE
ncbi:MAG: PTS sugar transporter subunit IIA [Firmicutes bacterium]|nr:PTS sugar transporter subunit IIA [Bacillota bacterium]